MSELRTDDHIRTYHKLYDERSREIMRQGVQDRIRELHELQALAPELDLIADLRELEALLAMVQPNPVLALMRHYDRMESETLAEALTKSLHTRKR